MSRRSLFQNSDIPYCITYLMQRLWGLHASWEELEAKEPGKLQL